ncbi:MAG: hypothetical protein H0V06_06765 [Gemmatimonadetes bacterium]|nr:hypothetical protein [Gemmatimonadota bacterium]
MTEIHIERRGRSLWLKVLGILALLLLIWMAARALRGPETTVEPVPVGMIGSAGQFSGL